MHTKTPELPIVAKILIAIAVGYLFSPIDLIPDFIPVLALLDDLLIVPLLFSISIKLIPKVVLVDARLKAQNSGSISARKSWIAAAIIIVIWFLIFFGTARYLVSRLSNH